MCHTLPPINLSRARVFEKMSRQHKKEPRSRKPVRGSSVSQSALDRIRTYGLLLRRQPLYPLSYEGKDFR